VVQGGGGDSRLRRWRQLKAAAVAEGGGCAAKEAVPTGDLRGGRACIEVDGAPIAPTDIPWHIEGR
jgi:hypothetical protein